MGKSNVFELDVHGVSRWHMEKPGLSKREAEKIRWHLNCNRDIEFNLITHGVLLFVSVVCAVGSSVIGITHNPLGIPLAIAFALFSWWNLYSYRWKDNFPKGSVLRESNDFGVGTSSLFEELCETVENYYENRKLIPEELVHETILDDDLFNQRAWEIACDLSVLGKLSDRSIRSAAQDQWNQSLNLVRAEIDKLKESVSNLRSVSVLASTKKIEDKYIDPTAGDTMLEVSKSRLDTHRELMPAPTPTPRLSKDESVAAEFLRKNGVKAGVQVKKPPEFGRW